MCKCKEEKWSRTREIYGTMQHLKKKIEKTHGSSWLGNHHTPLVPFPGFNRPYGNLLTCLKTQKLENNHGTH